MADATYSPKTYRKQGGDEFVVASGGLVRVEDGGDLLDATHPIERTVRSRFTIAQVNAGATILAAKAGYKYRLTDVKMIAVGGAVGAVTTVDIIGTQSTAKKLATFAQANLTEDELETLGDATVLAAGASFVANDANTAITIGKTGSDVTTATHIDVILSYAIEEA